MEWPLKKKKVRSAILSFNHTCSVLLSRISSTTGIMLDTTFTLKAVKGMMCEMKDNPSQFKGHRVLFIHTGNLLLVVYDKL